VASGGTGAATAAAARTALDVPSNAEAVLKADSAITVPRVNTLIIDSNAAVDISLRTNNGTEQVQINHVASSNRSLVLSGSNGGNPSIGVTGGAIALTTDTVIGGVLTVNSLVSGGVANVGMGTGSGSAVAIGTAHVNTTAVGNVGAGTDDLMSYSLPANSLSSNGKGLRVTCWGTAPVNAALKTLSFLFGGTSIFSGSLDPTANAVTWRIDVLIFRTGASTQDINFAVTESSGIFQAQRQACIQTTAAETDTSAITIKCTALGTSNNDVVQEGMLVEFIG